MKRILVLILLLISLSAWAGDQQSYVFPLIGKWIPSGQPIMSPDENGIQDVQNLRRDGPAWVGVKGHSKINSTLLTTEPYILNGFHFEKDFPAESHVLVLAGNAASPTSSKVYQNTTAIPTAGDFSATAVHTDAAGGMGTGKFSEAPTGAVVYSNGPEQMIWGGNETLPIAFLTAGAALSGTGGTLTTPADYSDVIINKSTATGQTATLKAGARTFLIGTSRPAQGFKIYISTANTSTATLAGAHWDGSTWEALTLTDNTSAGGKSLAQTGTVTFASAVGDSDPRYINDLSLYWYQFTLSDGGAVIYHVTVDSPIQAVTNLWSGQYIKPAKLIVLDDGALKDYTDEAVDGSSATSAVFYLSAGIEYILAGFTNPQQAIKFTVDPEDNNTTAGTMAVYYWNGAAYAQVTALTDGTASGGKPLAKTGVVSWAPLTPGAEQQTTAQDETPLYYYKIISSGVLGNGVANMSVTEVRGAESPKSVPVFGLSAQFQNRLFLLNETNGDRNKLWYSSFNTNHVFNGTDSGCLYIGGNSAITAAVPLFNIFKAGSYEQLIITKANEVYRLSGDGPSTWTSYRINANVGCVAPNSLVSAEVTEGVEEGVKRQVAIFQSGNGFYLTDGAAALPISEDIRCYFDANDSRAIPAARLSKTVAWYDQNLGVYKALISSGSSATYHNIELEYNLKTREWTKIYRADGSGANPLQSGWMVTDTNGVPYSYGGNIKGNLYRLENGYTWDLTAIAQYLWTKDFIPDKAAPLLRKSTIRNFRVASKKQAGTMTVSHYGDGVATVEGTNNQNTIDSINLNTAPYDSQSCLLGPFLYHSFKFACSASTNTGMELSGFGFWYEPYTIWR